MNKSNSILDPNYQFNEADFERGKFFSIFRPDSRIVIVSEMLYKPEGLKHMILSSGYRPFNFQTKNEIKRHYKNKGQFIKVYDLKAVQNNTDTLFTILIQSYFNLITGNPTEDEFALIFDEDLANKLDEYFLKSYWKSKEFAYELFAEDKEYVKRRFKFPKLIIGVKKRYGKIICDFPEPEPPKIISLKMQDLLNIGISKSDDEALSFYFDENLVCIHPVKGKDTKRILDKLLEQNSSNFVKIYDVSEPIAEDYYKELNFRYFQDTFHLLKSIDFVVIFDSKIAKRIDREITEIYEQGLKVYNQFIEGK